MRDTQLVAHLTCVGRILQGAAPAGRLARLLRIFAQRQVYADNIMTSLNKRRAAATEESTPPLIAANTRMSAQCSATPTKGETSGRNDEDAF
ncbi:hypothetical protein GCM10009537_00520 [Corynebacterium riegelii]